MNSFKKLNEKEKYIKYKSAKNAFLFETFALFIWSMWSDFGQSTSKGQMISWQNFIMIFGVAVYVLSNIYYSEKLKNEQNK